MIEGAPEFRRYVHQHVARDIAPKGSPKIYVSRSGLPPSQGGLLGEARLEAHLVAEGYEIYHPQEHPIRDQIAAYKGATHIISVEGSPIHLIALVGQGGQKVGIIARRRGNRDKDFARQLRSFANAEAHGLSCLVHEWTETHESLLANKSWGEVDFTKLWQELRDASLIEGRYPWPSLSAADLEAQLADISAKREPGPEAAGSRLVPVRLR